MVDDALDSKYYERPTRCDNKYVGRSSTPCIAYAFGERGICLSGAIPTTCTSLFRDERVADACDIETCCKTLTDRKVHGISESSHSLLRGVSLRLLVWVTIAHARIELSLHFGLLLASSDLYVAPFFGSRRGSSSALALDDPARRTRMIGLTPLHQCLSFQREVCGRCLRNGACLQALIDLTVHGTLSTGTFLLVPLVPWLCPLSQRGLYCVQIESRLSIRSRPSVRPLSTERESCKWEFPESFERVASAPTDLTFRKCPPPVSAFSGGSVWTMPTDIEFPTLAPSCA